MIQKRAKNFIYNISRAHSKEVIYKLNDKEFSQLLDYLLSPIGKKFIELNTTLTNDNKMLIDMFMLNDIKENSGWEVTNEKFTFKCKINQINWWMWNRKKVECLKYKWLRKGEICNE